VDLGGGCTSDKQESICIWRGDEGKACNLHGRRVGIVVKFEERMGKRVKVLWPILPSKAREWVRFFARSQDLPSMVCKASSTFTPMCSDVGVLYMKMSRIEGCNSNAQWKQNIFVIKVLRQYQCTENPL
jgi:hypothetical protein